MISEYTQYSGSQKCAYLNTQTNTWYANACFNSSDICVMVTSDTYMCTFAHPYGTSYPGEQCKTNSDCNAGYTRGCKNGICAGTVLDQSCQYNGQCEPNLYCNQTLGVCKPLIKVGESGCQNDYQCVNNAACNVTDYYNPSLNTCYLWHSFAVHDPVGGCNSGLSNLCPYDYCERNSDRNFYCTDLLSSAGTLAGWCDINSNGGCLSTTDPFFNPPLYIQGNCRCGLNQAGYATCQIFPGDMPYKGYLIMLKKWNSSGHITKCNTERRFSKDCVKAHWSKKESDTYAYYKELKEVYSKIQASQTCVIDTFQYGYARARDEYENEEGGGGGGGGGGGDNDDGNSSGAEAIYVSVLILIAIN